WLVPIGGMGSITAGLAAAAARAGAELCAGVEALAIEPFQRGAEVRFRDGEAERRASAPHVLVGAAPRELARLLGESADPQSTPEGSQLKVNLLLGRLPRLRDRDIAPERAFAGTFHVNESASQLQRAYEQAAAGTIPERPPCEAYCH